MQLIIDIPKEFEKDFYTDRFDDFFGRLNVDLNYEYQYNIGISGNYELETLNMLNKAFKRAKIINNSFTDFITTRDCRNCPINCRYSCDSKECKLLIETYNRGFTDAKNQ